MVNIFLQDEQTGRRRSSYEVAAEWVFANNNPNHDDRRLGQLARELLANKSYDEQLYAINQRRREMRQRLGSDYPSDAGYRRENELLNDLSAYVELGHRISQAGNADSIEISGLRGLVIAADNGINRVLRERRVTDEVQRRGARTPEQIAMEELIEPGDRARVQRVLDQFDGQNLTNAAILNRLENMQSGMGWMGESWDKAQALAVFRRQMQIENGATAQKPRGFSVISDAQAADTPAPNTTAVNESIREILGTAGAGLMNPDRHDHNDVRREAIAIVRRYQGIIHAPQAERDRVYGQLVRAYESKGGSTEGMANGYALDVLSRAVERENARAQGQRIEQLNRETFLQKTEQYLAYARNPAEWRRAHEQSPAAGAAAAPASDAPAAGAAAPAAGTAAPAGEVQERARLYRFGNQDAPPQSEIPVLAQNQVQDLQQKMVAAGIEFTRGADGKYGPNTHKALKDFAATLTPPITDLTQVDFTANGGQGDENAQRILQGLQARAQQRGGQAQGGETPAPAAGQPQLTEAGQRLLAAVQQHSGTSDAAVALRTLVPQDKQSAFDSIASLRGIAGDGPLKSAIASAMGLTEQEVAGLQFSGDNAQNLRASGDIIRNIETLINQLPGGQTIAVDGVLDARLGAILSEQGVLDAIRGALSNAQPLAVASAAGPAATPGQGNGGQGQGQGA